MKIIIAGYGKFGHLALTRLAELDFIPEIHVVDLHISDSGAPSHLDVNFHEIDILEYLINLTNVWDHCVIIPTVPFHLAAEYFLKIYTGFEKTILGDDLNETLPNVFRLDFSTICSSHADFLCPDNCPEATTCAVTGETRKPLFEKLSDTIYKGQRIRVIRSRQILPGIGGFKFRTIKRTAREICWDSSLVLATSCRCHGILTAIRRK
ncbi:MAG: hypothetical protein PHS86_13820 [Syntrophaceae bacterium]|nr:hypothetical protein [Syntrophaceae bacterium]